MAPESSCPFTCFQQPFRPRSSIFTPSDVFGSISSSPAKPWPERYTGTLLVVTSALPGYLITGGVVYLDDILLGYGVAPAEPRPERADGILCVIYVPGVAPSER